MKSKTAGLFVTVILAGCTTLPKLPNTKTSDIPAVIDAVQCEIQEAVAILGEKYPQISKWGVGVSFSLLIEENSKAAPTLSRSSPFAIRGPISDTLTLGANIDAAATARRTVAFKLSFPAKSLATYNCKRPPGTNSQLGVGEWMSKTLSAIDDQDKVGDLTQLGTTINFITSAGAGLNPQFLILRDIGRVKYSSSNLLTFGRSENNTLDIVFTPIPASPKPTEVIIIRRNR